MVKRSSFKTLLSLLLIIIIAALQLEASVPMKTFHLVNEWKNWSDAQQHCKEKFTDLASAGSHREDLLNELEKNGAKYVWIGLYRDPGNASVWRWTGEREDASRDTNWATTREPEMKNCTYVWYSRRDCINTMTKPIPDCTPSEKKYWRIDHCSESKKFFCSDEELDRVQFQGESKTWFDARESCKKKSMVLATVTQSNDDMNKTGWIGLHIPPNTPGIYTSKDIWKWTGKDSEYRQWDYGQPNHGDCGYFSIKGKRGSTNSLRSDHCWNRRPFICFADNVILVKENKTWEEALDHCRAIGSDDPSQHNHYSDHQYDLVSLQSDHDHRYARDKIQEATTNEVWTALRFLAGEWLWVDGEPLQYQNLPLCPAWGRRCGTLPKDHTTQWETRDCMERRNFLCIKSPAKQTDDL